MKLKAANRKEKEKKNKKRNKLVDRSPQARPIS
jgi:hypothetical protein